MSAHHGNNNRLKIFLVWLPAFILLFTKWIIPYVGKAEFLLACAGWSNIVAMIDVAHELKEEGGGVGVWRAVAFGLPILLLTIILAWDLSQVLS